MGNSALKKTSKPKAEKVSVYPISDWSVTKYRVSLFINYSPKVIFNTGISLDVEDDEQGNFVGLGIYEQRGEEKVCYYWSDWELAKQLTIPPFIAHNGRTDLAKLQKWGFKVDESFLIYDTQLIAHIQDSSRRNYSLKNLAKEDLGVAYPSYEDLTGRKGTAKHVTLDKLPLDLVAEYNAMDCYATYKLYEKLTSIPREVYPSLNYFNQLEKPAALVLQNMETKGIRLDVPYLTELEATLSTQKLAIEKEIHNELGPINLNSPKQLLGALHEKGIEPKLKTKASTDKRALEAVSHLPLVKTLLQFSEVESLLTSFIRPYLQRKEEVVHPYFNQCGTRTGRLSCSNPNLMQIPRRTQNGRLVRRMFIPREGCLFGDADFGQIEPRILAHFSKDQSMLSMFNEGVDFHSYTATNLGIDREAAKVLNLSVGYRATYKSVSQQMKCSWNVAQVHIDNWWSIFPQLHDWQQKLIYESKKTGYVETLMGRRIKVDDLTHGNQFRREAAERQLINNLIQGSAAEVMKMAMIKADKAGISLLVQVHDELLVEEKESEIEPAMNVLIECMETAVPLAVPLTVEAKIGSNWADIH